MQKMEPKQDKYYLMLAWLLIVILTIVQMSIDRSYADEHAVRSLFYWPISIFISGYISIIFWIVPLYRRIIRVQNPYKIILFILHGLVFSLIYMAISIIIYEVLFLKSPFNDAKKVFYEFGLSAFHQHAKTYLFMLASLLALDYLRGREKIIVSNKNLENELNLVKLATIKAKLQPHFLFNTLNSVVAIMDENTSKAQNALINLSDLLRYSMEMKPEKLIPISGEVELLKKYISIEKARYENQLNIKWVCTDLDAKFKVPAMILQPIVENSIKHGFKRIKTSLNLIIEIDAIHTKIIVKNDGNSLPQIIEKGTGLQIVNQRIKNHFGDASFFRIHQDGEWVTNTIQIIQNTQK
ncbi:hypothetical protein FVB32_02910 [Flagellimonas hymeniacidonis]|uniref:Signal transduction histidine kinase internal region domain-containing protein n=1 Tax=Flagellimonas hymeniacidonis TaxID=2603628 RepID=A0A5C8V7C9_9FLAO|nr:histidine kinase [Flagellimonas hymeniacidonis]TXN37253.1 hypothetical protein FVB32_02910 [Flagellimonas hymeniacidonis]